MAGHLTTLPLLLLCAAVGVKSQVPSAGSNSTLDDGDSSISYSPSDSTIASGPAWYQVSGTDNIDSGVHTSNDPTATVQFSFDGTEWYLMGTRKHDRGYVTVSVDGSSVGSYDGYSSSDGTDVYVLFYQEGLQNTAHTVKLSNSASDSRVSGNPYMIFDAAFYNSIQSSSSLLSSATSSGTASSTGTSTTSPGSTTSAAAAGAGSTSGHHTSSTPAVVGGVLGALIVLGLLGATYFFLKSRRRKAAFAPAFDSNGRTGEKDELANANSGINRSPPPATAQMHDFNVAALGGVQPHAEHAYVPPSEHQQHQTFLPQPHGPFYPGAYYPEQQSVPPSHGAPSSSSFDTLARSGSSSPAPARLPTPGVAGQFYAAPGFHAPTPTRYSDFSDLSSTRFDNPTTSAPSSTAASPAPWNQSEERRSVASKDSASAVNRFDSGNAKPREDDLHAHLASPPPAYRG